MLEPDNIDDKRFSKDLDKKSADKWPVPVNYFESLPERISTRISAQKAQKHRPLGKLIWPGIAAAAVAVVLAVLLILPNDKSVGNRVTVAGQHQDTSAPDKAISAYLDKEFSADSSSYNNLADNVKPPAGRNKPAANVLAPEAQQTPISPVAVDFPEDVKITEDMLLEYFDSGLTSEDIL